MVWLWRDWMEWRRATRSDSDPMQSKLTAWDAPVQAQGNNGELASLRGAHLAVTRRDMFVVEIAQEWWEAPAPLHGHCCVNHAV
jgi:hypothetical protein